MNGYLSGYGRDICEYWYYIGDFKVGKRHGQGTLVFYDGPTYVGAWKDGKRHGQGKLTNAGGKVKEGDWIKDDFVKH